jgi:hypothetical protein
LVDLEEDASVSRDSTRGAVVCSPTFGACAWLRSVLTRAIDRAP